MTQDQADTSTMAATAATADPTWPATGFLAVPETTPEVQAMYDDDVRGRGYVMNLTRVWAQVPVAHAAFTEALGEAAQAGLLTLRQRGVLITACAATLGDSYCSLAWGAKLAGEAGPEVAGAVLRGEEPPDPQDIELARWARQVAGDPNGTRPEDVQRLRDVGLTEQQIFAATLFVALRLAFSTVNDALGALPDAELSAAAPGPVRDAVSYGRPAADAGDLPHAP
jgi:alkylhydroperoxidase family enzyme